MKRRKFTLIELLIVVAIIGILMGILLPVLSTVKTKGKEVKAKADMNSIVAACKQYESDYGIMPSLATADVMLEPTTVDSSHKPLDDAPGSAANYKALFQVLTGVAYPSGSGTAPFNIRNIRYLEVPSSYSKIGYTDPWGATYGIALDLNYDGTLGGSATGNTAFPNNIGNTFTLTTPVAVWSRGSTATKVYSSTEATTKYLYSWK